MLSIANLILKAQDWIIKEVPDRNLATSMEELEKLLHQYLKKSVR